jgi:hypothetical protein
MTGSIEIALDEMVRCVQEVYQPNNKPILMWIETESDRLAPPNTITQSEKRRIHTYYIRLLSTLIQGNMGN